jgi:hypothetical protein
MAGSLTGIHRLEVDKPHPFKPDEEKKHGGKVHGHAHHHKLGRKRGGSVKKKPEHIVGQDGKPSNHGTDIPPEHGGKYVTPVQDVPMSGTESGYGGKTAFGKGHIEDSLKRGGSVKKKRDDGGNVTVATKTPSKPDTPHGNAYGKARSGPVNQFDELPVKKKTWYGAPTDEKFDDRLKDGGKVKWIQHAIRPEHKGMEQHAAKKAGLSTHAYMEKHKHDSGKSGARARLGLRLSSMAKHKKTD